MVLVLAAGCANKDEDSFANSSVVKSATADLKTLPKSVAEDSKKTFLQKDNMTALLIAGGATVVMNQGADENIEGYFERHEIFHGFTDRSLKFFGGPAAHFSAAGLWYAVSAENEDPLNKERAWTMIRALSVTGLATVSLKAIRNDDTPFGDRWGWPSGHTSSSFTVASVLDEFYGPQVGVPAYVIASLVGLRMIDQEDHWGSDVVFGAVLGWVVGHTIAGSDKKLEVVGFDILPYAGGDGGGSVVGVNLLKRF